MGGVADGDVAAKTYVDVAEHGLGVAGVGVGVEVHHKHAGGCHVVHVQEFPVGGAGAPQPDPYFAREVRGVRVQADHGAHIGGNGAVGLFVLANAFQVASLGQLGQVELADQGWQHVAVFQVIVVARAVEVGRHHAAVIAPVLAVVAFAELDAGNLGHRVGLVAGFEHAGQERVFAHGLGHGPGVDAARAQKQQLVHAMLMGSLDHVGLDHQVLVDEVGRVGVVGMDAPHLGGRQIHLVRLLRAEELRDRCLIGQVEFGMSAGDDVVLPGLPEVSQNRPTHHATVARHEDLRGACAQVVVH